MIVSITFFLDIITNCYFNRPICNGIVVLHFFVINSDHNHFYYVVSID